jgi:DNA-binding transcriptional LysR family regulator
MDFRRLDLNLLLVLDALFTERSASAAGQRLQVSQPTISSSLGKLREFFHDEMFVRTGGEMRPTALAESLREPVRRVIATLDDEILNPTVFDPATTERVFTISSSDMGEVIFLPDLLRVIRKQAPKAGLQMVSMHFSRLQEAMSSGEVDLAGGYFPDFGGSTFFEQKLFDHPFVCLASAHHATIGDSITLQQFLAAEHAVVAQETRSQEIFERRLKQLGLQRRVMLRTQHFMSLPALVAQSNLIAIVPRAVGQLYPFPGELKFLPLPIEIPLIEIKQFWHRRAHNDPAVTWLRRLMNDLFRGRDPSAEPRSPIFHPNRQDPLPGP